MLRARLGRVLTRPQQTPPERTTSPRPTLTHRYGEHHRQVADLWVPSAGAPRGVVVLVHGGFWRAAYDRSLQDAVVADLVAAGWAVWNVEYRPVGDGGGWPVTFTDVAAAVDCLPDVTSLPLDRLVAVGHSAGGTLAAWLAARHVLPDGAPGAGPRVRPVAVCAQAGVLDLAAAAREGVGRGAVTDLLGAGPEEEPERWSHASPAALLPTAVPLLALTGAEDDVVPPGQSEAYVAAARAAGDDARLEVVPDEGHMEHLDPASACWAAVRAWLASV
ncbi:esterase [Actinotalea ferrariae CF5-4]|uniref:Esterase n=1 Tax=Actinotalea ferrariae CF5-4 TaxID=948458 RepID=A0A021VYG6_9CELL|nr:alpha/beta hydrolase [Actinotalea ferrariae]EYR64112.1 esterase [Actinotalea ferrariae CF5-4]